MGGLKKTPLIFGLLRVFFLHYCCLKKHQKLLFFVFEIAEKNDITAPISPQKVTNLFQKKHLCLR
jgi:hypothetical protein